MSIKRIGLAATSASIVGVIFLLFAFTLGTRMSTARNIYVETMDILNGTDEFDNIGQEEIISTLQDSLDLWYDPEVASTLETFENQYQN